MKCPNLKHPDAVALIAKIGMVDFFKEYRRNNFEIPDPAKYQDSLRGVNAVQKIIGALAAEKSQQNFERFYLKGNAQKFFAELLNAGATADQVVALKSWAEVNNPENVFELMEAVAAETSYTIEIEPAAVESGIFVQSYQIGIGRYLYGVFQNREEIGTFEQLDDARAFRDELDMAYRNEPKKEPEKEEDFSKHYENLTAPGGMSYRELGVRAPGIMPFIKAHAAFATEDNIGWFRTDEVFSAPIILPGGFSLQDQLARRRLAAAENKKTRRILELQSDLFQKGRGKTSLVKVNKSDIGESKALVGTDGFVYIDRLSDDRDDFGGRYFKIPQDKIDLSLEENAVSEENAQYLQEVTADDFDKATLEKIEADPLKKSQNEFLQMLGKKDSWVGFFVRSILQDSARKGYKNILFPSANTVAIIEGFTGTINQKQQSESTLPAMEDTLAKLLQQKEELGESFTDDETLEILTENIEQTKYNIKDAQKHFEKSMLPTMNFYEVKLQNFLKKNYPVTDTVDDHGNKWFSVEVDPDRDLAPISYYDNSNTDSHKVKVYQGFDGPFADLRNINYFAASPDEAADYGRNLRAVMVNTIGFIEGFSEEEYRIRGEFNRQYKKTFDLFDNSIEGLATQQEYFLYLKSKGFNGWNSLNREDAKYLITFDNSNISDKDEPGTKPQEVEGRITEKLVNFLGKLNVTVEEFKDLREITGFNAIAATDFLYKTVLIKQGVPESVLAKETAYVAYSFLGKKNKIRTDLMASIEQLDNFAAVKADYLAKNPELSDYKLRELILVDFLSEAIQNEWKMPAGEYEGREASYWQIKGNTKLEKKINYLLAQLRRAFLDFIGKRPLSPAGVDRLMTDIARDMLDMNFRKFNSELTPEQQQVFYDTTIAADPNADAIVQFMQSLGIPLTGSLALRKQGSMYRSKAENLHDLDFSVSRSMIEPELAEFYRMLDGLFTKFPLTKDLAEKQFWPLLLKMGKPLFDNLSVIQNIRKVYPQFEVTAVFKGVKPGEISMAGKIDNYVIDLFFVRNPELDTNERGFQDWEEVFKAKIAMGRAKDISDFANYVPFSQRPNLLAQSKGLRHFNFERIVKRQIPAKEVVIHKSEVFEYAPEINERAIMHPYFPGDPSEYMPESFYSNPQHMDEQADQDSFYQNTEMNHDWNINIDIHEERDAVGKDIFGTDWDAIANGTINQDDEMKIKRWDDVNKKYFTYREYWDKKNDEYQQNKAILIGWKDDIDNGVLLGYHGSGNAIGENITDVRAANASPKTSTTELLKIYKQMLQMGNVEKKNMGKVFMQVGNALGDRMILSQLVKVAGNPNNSIDPDKLYKEQEDINGFQLWLQAKSDFGAGQAGIQMASKLISAMAKGSEQEAFDINQDLQELMNNIIKLYYANSPRSLRDRFNVKNWGDTTNKPFEYLYDATRRNFISTSSPAFLRMEHLANTQRNTSAGKLAKAQLDLYYFIYDTNKELLEDTEFDGKQGNRALMPHTSMDTYEAYRRFGFFRAYMQAFAPDVNTLFGDVEVYNPKTRQTKKVSEWEAQYFDPNQSFIDKAAAPKRFSRIVEQAQKNILAGQTNVTGMELKQQVLNFRNSAELPFRSLARRKDASINTYRILTSHFNSLVFKKHHDKAVPYLHSLYAYYKNRSINNPDEFKHTLKYLENYSDRYLFKGMDGSERGFMARFTEKLTVAAVLSFLGFAPSTAMYNAMTGIYFGWKTLISEASAERGIIMGLIEGTSKYRRGVARLTANGSVGARWKNGNALWSPKAQAILEFYNIETFSKLDIERQSDMVEVVKDWAMALQRNSELMVRGISFFAEMSEDQWNAFTFDNGKLDVAAVRTNILNGRIPSQDQVIEWNYYISAQQGNYSPEDRRNYHINNWAKFGMLFKGWIPDYMQERFRYQWVDQYGNDREGYITTGGRLLKEMVVERTKKRNYSTSQYAAVRRPVNIAKTAYSAIELLWSHRQTIRDMRASTGAKLTKREKINLNKIFYDGAMYSMLILWRASLDDEDDKKLRAALLKFTAQLFFGLRFKDVTEMASKPFPQFSLLLNLYDAMIALCEGDLEKARKKGSKVVPGNRLVNDIVDFYEWATEE